MMIKASVFGIFLLWCLQTPGQITLGSSVLNLDLIADTSDGLQAPWDLAWGPDDHLWFTDAEKIKRLDPVNHQIIEVFHKPGFYAMSMAFHPDFNQTPQVFVIYDSSKYYSSSSSFAHLLRYDYDSDSHSFSNETLLFRYQHYGEHIGGRVIFTADGKLLLTSADYNEDLTATFGKTLRFNPDGSIPSDNPFPGDPTWSWGHRNPQGLLAHPNGRIYSTEHGGGTQKNELNIIRKEQHFGWPGYDALFCRHQNLCNSPGYEAVNFPIYTYEQPPCGIDWYDNPAIPELQNHLMIACLGAYPNFGGLLVLGLNADGDSVENTMRLFGDKNSSLGRIRDVCVAPDGAIWMICNDRSMLNYNSGQITSLANIRVLYKAATVPIPETRTILLPNPVINTVFLQMDDPLYFEKEGRVELRIFSSIGHLVYQAWIVKPNQRIDANQLSKGTYSYQVRARHGQVLGKGKFIKH